jgi:predicted nucleotidyltransferase
MVDKVDTIVDAEKIIREMADRIAKRFSPDKIILFGSYARGTAGPDSDADFLVVMPVNGSRRELSVKIATEISGLGLPKDVLVVTPEELERDRNAVGTIIKPALSEGRMLFERHV